MDFSLPYLIAVFFNFFALYIPQTALLNKPFTKKKHCIYIVCLIILCILPLFISTHNFIYIFLSFLALGVLSNKHIINTILSLIGYITGVCYNYIAMEIYHKVTGVTQAELYNLVLHSVIFYIFYFVTLYGILRLIRKLVQALGKIDRYTHKSLIISLILFLAFCAFIFIINFTYEQKLGFPAEITKLNQTLFSIFFLFSFIILCIIIIIIYKDAKTREALKEMEYLKMYTTEIENLYSSMKSFKHDYTNILYSMKNYIDNSQIKELYSYYYSNIIPLVESLDASNPAVEQLSNIKVPELKSILYLKILEADKLGITTNLEVKWPIEEINMKPIDLTRIIGVFLDNAIESTAEITAQHKVINIACIKSNEDIVIIIENPTAQENINLHKIKGKGISTKGHNRGTGLHNVHQILSRYENTLLSTEHIDNTFRQTLEITQ